MNRTSQVPESVRRILLAVDLTPSSAGAVGEAIQVAREHHSELVVLSVVEPAGLRLPGAPTRRVDQERGRLETGVRAIVERARTAGVRATYLIWAGDPADLILEASVAEAADLIILGSRGRGPLKRRLLGSVSAHVAHAASCPVVIIGG